MSKVFAAGAALLGLALAVSPGWGQSPKAAPGNNPAKRAFLGAFIGATDENAPQQGAVVGQVTPNSPAAKAGLQNGDVITGVNGQEMKSPNQFRSAITKAGAGKEVRLEVLRGKEKKDLDAKLGEAPVDGFGSLPLENFPDLGNVVPGRFVTSGQEARRIQELQERVQQLEQQKQGTTKKSGTGKK